MIPFDSFEGLECKAGALASGEDVTDQCWEPGEIIFINLENSRDEE